MDVRVWGVVDDRLIEVQARPVTESGTGLRIEGLPEGRARTTADRIRAALVNSGLLTEAPGVELQLLPALSGPETGDLDLALALAVLAHVERIGKGLRWILASGRLGLDASVHADGLGGQATLADAAGSCQTPPLQSEHMFGDGDRHE